MTALELTHFEAARLFDAYRMHNFPQTCDRPALIAAMEGRGEDVVCKVLDDWCAANPGIPPSLAALSSGIDRIDRADEIAQIQREAWAGIGGRKQVLPAHIERVRMSAPPRPQRRAS